MSSYDRTVDPVPGDAFDAAKLGFRLVPDPGRPFPQAFGRYRLLEHLGSGAMGTVYLADDLKLEIKVALKFPRPEYIAVPRLKERFYREARAAARLVHPGLGWVIDVGQVEEMHYLVMRYVPGTPLSRCPARTPPQAAALIRDVAIAMAAAHREGVIHRDLKPSNIVVMPGDNPVVIDFGLALLVEDDDKRLTDAGDRLGTLRYMPPEQFFGVLEDVGPQSDIYALGCVLYEQLAGRPPFANPRDRLASVADDRALRLPSAHHKEIDAALDAICLRALARLPGDRYLSMSDFAADLDAYLNRYPDTQPLPHSRGRQSAAFQANRPLISRAAIRFVFAGASSSVIGAAPDRLFLGIGNDLRPGVIDRHQLHAYGGSTSRLVVSHPELVTGAVRLERDADSPFTIVLHEAPDFDAVAATYLAVALLTSGQFPPGTDALARYADKIDEGSIGHTLIHPFAPYAVYMQLLNRHSRLGKQADHSYWRECVEQGLRLIAYVLERSLSEGLALPSVDAFACPDLFSDDDRHDVLADVERYHRKLADPATRARQVRLRLPGQYGGRVDVDTLLVRDVQNPDDQERCIFFKDWARSDRERSTGGAGFLGLSVFMTETPRNARRCIVSVTPDSGASLRTLAGLLDQAESERRLQVHGEDDRVIDPATGSRKPPRAGYNNADPWYDGRAHGFTIVDSPRSGTLLTADEIEAIVVSAGGGNREMGEESGVIN
jgi:serine/threonine protein kinase